MAPTPWDELTLAARRGVFADQLPSNRELPNDVTQESLQKGWTVQQPYAHASCVVALDCVLCGQPVNQRDFVDHSCMVRLILGELSHGST